MQGGIVLEPLGRTKKPNTMIGWIIGAALLSVLFAILGFGGISSGFAKIAKLLFYIFVIVLIVTVIMNFLG